MGDPVLVLKALADPVRWQLVQTLAQGPRTTGALAAGFEQTRYGVMKHLEVLVAAGLLTVERRGRERWNHLNPVPLAAVLEAITTPLGRRWANRLLALGRAVATEEDAMTINTPAMIDIRQDIRLAAAPARVYEVLTRHIDSWWTAPYRMTEGGRMTLDARIGGELREDDGAGHVAVWGRVEEIAPGRLLVLAGAFGLPTAAAGRVRLALTPDAAATLLTLSHVAVGPLAEDAGPRYRAGWADLLGQRLRAQVEAR
jgi:uncharacterized protein YndB with AHSA1/START domain/DNA-binding transcriptional ArsR family regulator